MKKYYPNLDYVDDMSEGDEIFRQNLLKIIKSEFLDEKEAYLNYFKNENYVDSARLVHKLLHKIAIFGLGEAHKLGKIHEEALKESSTKYHLDFIEIMNAMSNFLENEN